MTTRNELPHPRLRLLEALQSETMLGAFRVYQNIKAIPEQMIWRGKTYKDYFEDLQGRIADVGSIVLRHGITEIDAGSYLVDIAMSYERVLDGINQRLVDSQAFLGRLRTDQARIAAKQPGFLIYWMLGFQDITEGGPLAKVKETDQKALALDEFSAVLGEAELDLQAMIEAMEITVDNLKNAKRLADMKYAMAKDQVNTVLAGLDQGDRGVLMAQPTTHGAGGSTLKGLFGDRVRESEPAAELDEDLPMVPPAVDSPILKADVPEEAPEAEVPVATAAEAPGTFVEPTQPALPKPTRGGSVQVSRSLNLACPGPLNVTDYLLGKGKTKLSLLAQENPEENGLYRWHGPDAPLERIVAAETPEKPRVETTEHLPGDEFSHTVVTHSGPKAESKATGISLDEDLPVAEPKAEKVPPTPKAGKAVHAEAPAAPTPVDPRLSPTAPVLDEDLPVATPSSSPALDEDLPAAAPAPKSNVTVVDEDDDFPTSVVVINRTPASQELADMQRKTEEVTTPLPAEAPAKEPAKAVQAAVTSTVAPVAEPATPKPVGNLFRPRGLAPGQTMVPPFRPTAGAPVSVASEAM